MALRGLVEGECGAANPLVQWTSHFSQEKSMLRNGLEHDRLADLKHHGSGQVLEDQMVNEFLGEGVPHHQPAVPQTFNMASLLNEIQAVPHQPHPHQQHQQQPPQQATSMHDDVRVKEWVEEFSPMPAQAHQLSRPGGREEGWVREFEQHRQKQSEEWAREFAPTEDEKWVAEFEEQMRSSDGGRDLQSVARDMTQAVTDPDIQASEFMDFVKKLASGELGVDEKNEVVPKDGSEWVKEFEKEAELGATANGGFWDRLEKEWEDLAKQDAHPWLQDFTSFQKETAKEYQFEEDNPLREVENPLEEGLKRLKEGDLPSAVLLFEAEVQARPDSVQGWQYLGSTQADNEQDIAAIAALNRCLELDPGNLPAHMSLAVCYTNESRQIKVLTVPVCKLPALEAELHCCHSNSHRQCEALEALRGWIRHNPKYAVLLPGEVGAVKPDAPLIHSFMTKEEHAEVRDLFLKAAQISPEQVDADIQVGLGVLFNLSNEYDKAVDCFSAALAVRPDDAMLWNKLGATLANSNKSGEAVEAYRKALEYLPGFTRSRYNLGVSCINLGAYKEAVEHFLIALNMQRQAKGPGNNRRQMSESIWSTLRLAVTFVGKQELNKLVDSRDLDGLMSEFGV